MTKFTKQLLTGVIALGLLAPVATSVTVNNPAVRVNASSWHYGVPRAIKGKWISRFMRTNRYYHHGYWKDCVGVSGNKYGFNPFPWWYNARKHFKMSGATNGEFWNPHYRYLGHGTYRIVSGGNAYHSHSLRKVLRSRYHITYTIHMHGHNHFSAWYHDQYGEHSYEGYFHRVHHF